MKPSRAAKLFLEIMLAQAGNGDVEHTGGAVPGSKGRYYIRFEWEAKDDTRNQAEERGD